ncbi:MAG TPA: PilZ domain-containing protein [Bryobacteraceae bacterium]|nr:PilZ domain-containing protein [Bryobacteraceae bacterium]
MYPESVTRINRRGSTRVAVRLVCHVVWPQGGESIAMLTENMSRDGMLLRWEQSGARVPNVGEMIIVEVELPEQEGFERRCIRCQTTVARVHPEAGATFTWVGLRIHAMDFRLAQAASAQQERLNYNGQGSRAL